MSTEAGAGGEPTGLGRAAPIVARALPQALQARRRALAWRRSLGFPWTTPTWPGGVERPPVERTLGADFDTEWARKPPARVARALVLDGVVRPAVDLVASPTVSGLDRLDGLEGPVIFVGNHASHLDTPLLLTSLPDRFRHRTVVAAAADYFFDRRLKAVASALALAAIPIDRTTVSRRSLHLAEDLLDDGWNLIIFPEGGRTADGWGRDFEGGAAYLATRRQVPVVPVHIEGSRRVWRKGGALRRATTHVTFGTPIRPGGASLGDARAMTAAMEHAVAVLADEQATDWWSARRRSAAGTTPALQGPTGAAWRRSWARAEGARTTSGPRWPA
ncbi:MAG TPA: lysophospholipid acyltransferase family protein [Acidimicrobiales bacterium]